METILDLFEQELKDGTESSQYFFSRWEVKNKMDFDALLENDFEDAGQRLGTLLVAIDDFAQSRNQISQAYDWVVSLFLNPQDHSSQLRKFAAQNNDSCKSIVEKRLSFLMDFGGLVTIAKYFPTANGLAARIVRTVEAAVDNLKKGREPNSTNSLSQWRIINEVYPYLRPQDRPEKAYVELANFHFDQWNRNYFKPDRIMLALKNLGFDSKGAISWQRIGWSSRPKLVYVDGKLFLRFSSQYGTLDIAKDLTSSLRSSRTHVPVGSVEQYIKKINQGEEATIRRDTESKKLVFQGKGPQIVYDAQQHILEMLAKIGEGYSVENH
jgi:hypothetical protein